MSVSLDARYTGAWSEIATRIAARQNVISIYVAMTYPILGFSLTNSMYAKLCWLILPATITCVLLVKMHEEMIGNLHNYCRWCEHIGNSSGALPSYHVETDPWCSTNPKIRQQNDFILHILLNAPIAIGMIIILWSNQEWFEFKNYDLVLVVAMSFFSVGVFNFFTIKNIKTMRKNIYDRNWTPSVHEQH